VGGGSNGFENPSCTAQSPCTFRDYVAPNWGVAAMSRPRANAPAAGTATVFYSGTGGFYRLWNLQLKGTLVGGEVGGDPLTFFSGTSHDVEICGVRLDDFPLGIQIASADSIGNVTVQKSEFHSNGGLGAIFGCAHNLVVDSNRFYNYGLYAMNHTIYIGGGAPGGCPAMNGMRFTNNVIDLPAACAGSAMTFHGGSLRDVLIENNQFTSASTNGNCYAFAVGSGWELDENLRFKIRRNRVTVGAPMPSMITAGPPGNPGPSFASAIGVEGCKDCEVADNVVIGGTVQTGMEDCSQTSADPLTCPEKVLFQNNTLINARFVFGDRQQASPALGYFLENNVVWQDGTANEYGDVMACVELHGSPRFERNSNNYCRNGAGLSLAQLFVAPPADWRPLAGGPLDGAANQTWYSPMAIGTVSWTAGDPGKARAPPIDLGAFEAP
jgi:hypothetical protein